MCIAIPPWGHTVVFGVVVLKRKKHLCGGVGVGCGWVRFLASATMHEVQRRRKQTTTKPKRSPNRTPSTNNNKTIPFSFSLPFSDLSHPHNEGMFGDGTNRQRKFVRNVASDNNGDVVVFCLEIKRQRGRQRRSRGGMVRDAHDRLRLLLPQPLRRHTQKPSGKGK